MFDYLKTEEKLINVQLKLLKSTHIKTVEKLSISIKTTENLSANDKITSPIKVKGKMLGVGRHKKRFYTEEELKKSVEMYKANPTIIPIKVDHRVKEAGATIGLVDLLIWDVENKIVRYEGHINDLTHARNIRDRAITDVSASIQSFEEVDPLLGIVGLEPEYVELSVVHKGAFTGNTIEVV